MNDIFEMLFILSFLCGVNSPCQIVQTWDQDCWGVRRFAVEADPQWFVMVQNDDGTGWRFTVPPAGGIIFECPDPPFLE